MSARSELASTGRSEQGSLPLALLFTMVALSLSVVTLPTLLVQTGGTRSTVTREHALVAAQTGLEIGVAAVRAAYQVGAAGTGDRALLPCAPIVGAANDLDARSGSPARASYRVSMTYYDDDPEQAGANPVDCVSVARAPGAELPAFVRFTSTGAAAGGLALRRALRADYPLRLSALGGGAGTPTGGPTAGPGPGDPAATATAPPGVPPAPTPTWGPQLDLRVQPRGIVMWGPDQDEAKELCLDPGASRPAPGARVRLQTCDTADHEDNGYKQNWYYRENLTLSPVASLLVNKANAAMCLDAGASPGIGVFPTMQVCVEPAPARQRWYHNSAMNFELAAGSAADGWSLSGLCLNAAKPDTAGADVVLGGASNCHGAYDTRQTFGLFTKVGPGEAGRRATDCTAAAGYPCAATQLLTHAMPARCADRYGGQMVMFDCAQAPDPAGLPWNQVWRVANPPDGPAGAPEKPIVTIDPGGAAYCLTSSSSGALSQRECDPQAPAADQKFDQYRNTGDAFTMYRIVDSRGRCLTHANGQDTGDGTSLLFRWNPRHYNWRLIVRACINSYSDPDAGDDFNRASGLSRQKWNAPFVLPTKLPPATAAPTPPGAEPTTQAPTPSPVPTPTAAVPTAAASPLAAAVAALSLRNLVEIPPPD